MDEIGFSSHMNTYTGKEIFSSIRLSVGERKPIPSSLRSEIPNILTELIRQRIPVTSPLSEDYKKKRIEYILMNVKKNLGVNCSKVAFMSYDDGMYRFYDTSQQEIYHANIVSLWNESNIPPEKLTEIHARARAEEESLKTTLERESVM